MLFLVKFVIVVLFEIIEVFIEIVRKSCFGESGKLVLVVIKRNVLY